VSIVPITSNLSTFPHPQTGGGGVGVSPAVYPLLSHASIPKNTTSDSNCEGPSISDEERRLDKLTVILPSAGHSREVANSLYATPSSTACLATARVRSEFLLRPVQLIWELLPPWVTPRKYILKLTSTERVSVLTSTLCQNVNT